MAGKEVATLFVELKASFAKFQADMGQVSKTFSSLGKNVDKAGKQLTSAFTLPLGILGASAIAAAKDVDEAFDAIRAGTGATGDALESLEGSFKTVFSESVQGAQEVGKAIAQLNTGLGLTGKPLETLAKQATGIAQVTGQELGGTIKGTISLMNAWKVSTEEQSSTMDFLFKVGQKTNQNIGELEGNVAKFQPTLSRLGLGLKESAALFGILGKNGMEASQVMGAFNIAVTKFTKAGVKDMGAALKLSFEGIKRAPSDTAAAAAAMDIFGKKAGPQLAALIRSGKLSLDAFLKTIEGSSETIAKAVEDTDSFADKFVKFRHKIELALEPVGTPILDTLSKAMDVASPKIKALGEWFGSLNESTKGWAIGLGTALAVIGPVIKVIGVLFGWVARLGPVFELAVAGVTLLAGSLALLVTPLGLVAAAVGVAIAAWYEWDTVSPMIDQFAADVNVGLSEIGRIVTEMSDSALDSVKAFGQGMGEAFVTMKDNCLAVIGQMVTGINEWFTGKFETAKQAVVGFADDVLAVFEGLKAAVLDHSPVPDLVNGVGQEFNKLEGNMVTPTKAAAQGVLSSFEALRQGVNAKTKSGVDDAKKLGEAWKKTAQDIKSISSDFNKSIDPLRGKITQLLQAKDFDGITKLAEGFKGSKDGLDQFRKSLSDAKGDFGEWQRNQDALNEKLRDTQAELYELNTGQKLIDPLTQSVTQLMAAGDMEGLRHLGDSMQDTEVHARAFDRAMSQSMDTMRQMKSAGDELANSLSQGLGGMFSNFGMDSTYSDALSGLLGGAVTGHGSGGAGQLGNWINQKVGGGGNIFSGLLDSVFGGSGGGSGGGSIVSTILGKLGLGGSGSSQAISEAIGQNMDGTYIFADTASAATEASSSIGSLAGAASSAAGYLGVANDALQSLGKIGKDRASTFEGVGQIGGTALGAIFGGPQGAAIGSSIGKVVGKFLGTMFGGASKNKETIARKSIEKFLEDAFANKNIKFRDQNGQMQPFDGNFKFGSRNRFDKPGWADEARSKYGDKSTQVYDSIGRGLTKVLGITENVGPQIGAILQESLNGNLDNARILTNELGVSQQQMEEAFESMGESGEMSWHAVEVSLQGVAMAYGEGLVAMGDFAGGFQQIIDSAGDGKDAILGIKNAAVEAKEASIKNFGEWKAKLLEAGKDPEWVNAFFGALDSRGLKSFEDIKGASTRVLGGVVADMQSNSSTLAEVWVKAQQESQKYLDTVSKIPDNSTKNVELNVTANVSGDARKVLDMQPSAPVNMAQPAQMATGGIATKPTLSWIAEAGEPEAVLPLSRLPGMVKSMNGVGGGNSGTSITINAPNATPGVPDEIRRVIKDLESDIINRTLDTIQDFHRRGGV